MHMHVHIEDVLPFIPWLRRYNRHYLKADLFAGLTVAVVALPQSMAYAIIAGLPVQYGLYASIVPTIIGCLWGSSAHLITGPTTTASLVVFSALSSIARPGSLPYIELAFQLIRFEDIRRTLRATRSDAAVLVVTFLFTVFLNIEFSIYVGVLLSIGLHLAKTSHPRIYSVVPDLATGKMVGFAQGQNGSGRYQPETGARSAHLGSNCAGRASKQPLSGVCRWIGGGQASVSPAQAVLAGYRATGGTCLCPGSRQRGSHGTRSGPLYPAGHTMADNLRQTVHGESSHGRQASGGHCRNRRR